MYLNGNYRLQTELKKNKRHYDFKLFSRARKVI
jgi:hypothetical protein